jgi:hypothetical protein
MDAAVSVEYLDLLRDVLRDYVPPSGSFDPSGHWFHHYRLYTLVNARKLTLPTPRIGGRLSIRRTPQATGGAILNVNYEKTTQFAEMHTLLATLVCAGDNLATPVKWETTYTAAAPAHPLKMSLELRETGMARDRSIFIERGTVQKKLLLSSPFTSSWSLFDAVQRLARPVGAPLRFTLLDAGDAPKPNQVLAFYQSADLKNRWPGAPTLRVHGFLQIGDGISPQVFWVDDRGELLFLLSGLDAYVLDAGAPASPPSTRERS